MDRRDAPASKVPDSGAPESKARGGLSAISELLLGCPIRKAPALVPGLALAAVVLVLAVVLTDALNSALGFKSLVSYIMVAILIGLVVGNVLPIPVIFSPGLAFCLKKLLRLGIIVMGLRLSVVEAAKIGMWGVPIVVICIATGLGLTLYFTKLLKLPPKLGALIALGTGICGASAIVAAAPAIEADEEEVAYAVATITVFGILAMLIYPFVASVLFSGNTTMAGLFLGTSIHETSQVTGAGLIYDQAFQVTSKPGVADIAIVTKLVRNLFMAVCIPLIAVVYFRMSGHVRAAGSKRVGIAKLFPIFILGFVLMAVVRSIGDSGIQAGGPALGFLTEGDWKNFLGSASTVAGYLLATAMAAVGIGTRVRTLRMLGLKPFYVGLLAALVVGLASVVATFVLGSHASFS